MPIAAALGGMLLPASSYLILNAGDTRAVRRWGIPISTDIAFSLAVLALLGHRIPAQVRTFLLAFATADEVGGASMLAGIGGYLFLRLTGERVSTRPD